MTLPDSGERLSILVVTQYFWPENFQINHVVRGLRALGHDVVVLTGKPNYPGGKLFPGYSLLGRANETFEGVPVVRVPLVPRGAGGGARLALNYLSFAASASFLGPLRVKGRFDAIFVYEPSPVTVGLPALAMKRHLDAPVVFWVQDLWPESVVAAGGVRSKAALSWLDKLVRRIYAGCDLVLVQSEAFRRRVEAQGVHPERIRYFPQSVDGLFRPVAAAEAPVEGGMMPEGFRIVFAGNVGHAQSFETVLGAADALRDNPEIKWVVIGDGRRSEWLAAEIARRDLSATVFLLGRHQEERMPLFFAHADALLVTLRKEPIFALTIPTKVQAYLACGKPVLAGLDGEGARIVEDARAGYTAPAGDADALATAALALWRASPDERAEMAERAFAYSRAHFDRTILIRELAGTLRSAAQLHRSGTRARDRAA